MKNKKILKEVFLGIVFGLSISFIIVFFVTAICIATEASRGSVKYNKEEYKREHRIQNTDFDITPWLI